MRFLTTTGLIVGAAVMLSACQYGEPIRRDKLPGSDRSILIDERNPPQRDTVFGPGGINLFGGDEDRPTDGSAGIGVNSFLWRASLDTIAFMPLASADPFGGVIITDWFTPAESPDERFKINVYILAKALRADGIEVSVFKQARTGIGDGAVPGDWMDRPVEDGVGAQLEEAILTRARQLRMAALRER